MRNRFVQSCATVSVVVFFSYLLLSLNFTPNLDGVLTSVHKSDGSRGLAVLQPESIEDSKEVNTFRGKDSTNSFFEMRQFLSFNFRFH